MMNPVRAATGWFAGRLLVFLAILAALVAMDVYREESTLLGVMLKETRSARDPQGSIP